MGYYKGKRLIFAGRVGTGFNDKSLREIYAKLKKLECDEPQVEEVQEPSGRWRPEGMEGVRYALGAARACRAGAVTEWTDDGILRHPSFQGLRVDKNPRDVVRE